METTISKKYVVAEDFYLLDLDGVCRDTVKYVCDKYKVDIPTNYNASINGKNFVELIDKEECLNAPPTEYFKVFFDNIQNADQVKIITKNKHIFENTKWFINNGMLPAILTTTNKQNEIALQLRKLYTNCLLKGTQRTVYIIDDCLEEMQKYAKCSYAKYGLDIEDYIERLNIKYLLIDAPYNRGEGDFIRICSPEQLKKVLNYVVV